MADVDPVFIRACRSRSTPFTPIWLMRQAGRYQPEYRAIREKVSFVELCRTPELACQVTVQAVDQLGVDAAILFADILLILEPLGVGFDFREGDGPHIEKPLRTNEDLDRVPDEIDPHASLGYVMDTVRLIRRELAGRRIPLIGFSGAPFTLASYAVEGGGSRDYHHVKSLMYRDEGAFRTLMAKLSRAVAAYLNAQIDAGAEAVQVFDSWVGCLSTEDYERYVEPHMRALFDALGDRVPVIHFGQGNPELYPLMHRAGGSVISVDWRTPLSQIRARLGDGVALQGNLDPVSLLGPRDAMLGRAQRVLDEAGNQPGHIFNLGHGILRWSSVDQVRALVDYVHESSERTHT